MLRCLCASSWRFITFVSHFNAAVVAEITVIKQRRENSAHPCMYLFCIAATVMTPESWYATAPSVFHCGAGRWTCFPCAFIPKGSTSAGVQCTRSNVNIQLNPACNTHLWAKPCSAVHYTCTLTSLLLFFSTVHHRRGFWPFFSFKAFLWGLWLKSVSKHMFERRKVH